MIHAELQQTEAAALAGQPLVQQHLEVAAALEAGEGIRVVAILQGGMAASRWRTTPSSCPSLVATNPLLQPDVMALMVQDAVFEPHPLLRPLTGLQGLGQAGPVVQVHPGPASRDHPARFPSPSSCRQEGSRPQAALGRPGPDPGLQHRHGFVPSASPQRGVVTSTLGVSHTFPSRASTPDPGISDQSNTLNK